MMDSDGFVAERGTVGTVVFPVVAEGVTQSQRGGRVGRGGLGSRADGTIVAESDGQVGFSCRFQGRESGLRDKAKFSFEGGRLGSEQLDDYDQGCFVKRVARRIAAGGGSNRADAVHEELEDIHRSEEVDGIVIGCIHYHNICCI